MEDGINSVGEEENDSKGAAEVVDSWVRSMMKKLDPNHCKPSSFVICEVHRDIRKDDHGAYSPKIVSIGPFHRRKKNVQAMQKLKMHYVNNILTSADGNKERRLKECLKKMEAIEPFVRSCYSVKIKMSTKKFVEMMVVDGCFLIQLLFQKQNEIKNEDPIYNNYWRLPLIRHDILLLENQLPFVVLEELCRLIGGDYERTLWEQALHFYERLLPEEDDHAKRKKPEQIYHLLHLIHMFFKPAASALPQNTRGRSSTPDCMPLIYASTLTGSAPTHFITTDCMPPTPPGEQSAQDLQHTLSGEQSSLQACIRSGKHQFELLGSDPIYPITRPTASQGKQSLQELKHGPYSKMFPELSDTSPLDLERGAARINPKTKVRGPPVLPGKQSSQELQHTQSGQQAFENLTVKMSMAAESFIRTSSHAHPVTTHLWPPIPPGEQSSQDPAEQDIPSGQQYTLEVTYPSPVGASGNTQSKQHRGQQPETTIPSATELQEAGLTIQLKKATNNFLDVTFKEGKLEMPRLCIDDSTNSLFRNFITFEQYFPLLGSNITSYCFFMDSLVKTATDVGILSRKKVIENLLASDEDVAILFNKLCRGRFIDFEDAYLAEVYKNINLTKGSWPKHREELKRDYFSTPWKTLSVAAACLIILFTLVQTFFTVFAYFRPPKS